MHIEDVNKSFVVLLIAAIIVSVGTTLINLNTLQRLGSISGFSETALGTVTFKVNESVSITLIDNTVDFGNCVLNASGLIGYESNVTNGTTIPGYYCDGLVQPDDMVLENDGGVAVNVTLSSNVSGVDFIGSPTNRGSFWFAVTENETGSCASGLPSGWVNITSASTDYDVCENFNNIDTKDTLNIWYKIVLPDDTPEGKKSATITFSAVKV